MKSGFNRQNCINYMSQITVKRSQLRAVVKKKIIVYIYILMAISIYLAPILAVKIGLGALTVFITYYLFWVIPDKNRRDSDG